MKNFLKGAIFVALALPICEGFISIFNQGVECICMKIAAKTCEIQKEIQQDNEEVHTNAIGFFAPDDEEYYEDEEEDY